MENILDEIIGKEHQGVEVLTSKDLKSGLDVRWCSGCGGYSIISQIQKVLPGLGIPKENFVFISGIGCSSRFPYYMDTFGMHTIHGRALAIASGLSIARSDLSIWVSTGDGDCMSIGGNHFIHASRRNVNLNVMMFNNGIYSLTKGQYSPLSLPGQITKSSPLGVLDDPFNPPALALGAGASFVARAYDKDIKTMNKIFERAARHNGFTFTEVYANCVIYNDGAFDDYTKKGARENNTVYLEHAKPLVFGLEKDKGIKLDGFKPVVVSLTDGNHSVDDLLVHDEKDTTLGAILADMTYNENVPRPAGILHAVERPSYENKVDAQLEYWGKQPGANDLDMLMRGADSWIIE